jgi:hypothetical protein
MGSIMSWLQTRFCATSGLFCEQQKSAEKPSEPVVDEGMQIPVIITAKYDSSCELMTVITDSGYSSRPINLCPRIFTCEMSTPQGMSKIDCGTE